MAGFTAYTRANRWLYGVLTASPITGVTRSGLDVYEDAAPEGVTDADSVWIEFEALNPGDDVAEVGRQRIWTEFAFLVRAVKRGRSYQGLEAIADEIDHRLNRVAGTVSDGQVISSTRQEDGAEVPESWLKEGVEYRGLGQVFNLIVQPL